MSVGLWTSKICSLAYIPIDILSVATCGRGRPLLATRKVSKVSKVCIVCKKGTMPGLSNAKPYVLC